MGRPKTDWAEAGAGGAHRPPLQIPDSWKEDIPPEWRKEYQTTRQNAVFDRDDEVIARYRNGESMAEIGRAFGVTRERIRQIVRAAGVEPPILEQRRLAKAELEAKVEVADPWDPPSIQDTCTGLDLSASSFRDWLKADDPELYERIQQTKADAVVARREMKAAGVGVGECSLCHRRRPWSDFPRDKRLGRHSQCNPCRAAYVKGHLKAQRDQRRKERNDGS